MKPQTQTPFGLSRDPMKTTKHILQTLLGAVILALALAALAPATRAATPPQLMSYQGYVTDQTGNPLGSSSTGPKNYTIIFRMWNIPSGGVTNTSAELYAEQQTVTVNNGYFSVLLGLGAQVANEPYNNGNIASLFGPNSATTVFVELTVVGIGSSGNNVTILPRLQLVTSPYSFTSGYSATAGALVNSSNSPVLSVTGTNVAVPGNIVVNNATVNGTLSSGNATVNGTLQTIGNATVGGTLTSPTGATLGGNYIGGGHVYGGSLVLDSYGDLYFRTVWAPLNLGNYTDVFHISTNGNATVYGNLQVNSGATVDGALTVAATATMNGNLMVNSNASVVGVLTVVNDATVGGNLQVNNSATLNGNLQVNVNATVNGGVTAGSANFAGMFLSGSEFYAPNGLILNASGDFYFRAVTSPTLFGSVYTEIFHIYTNGNAYAIGSFTAKSYITSSDRNLKERFISVDPLEVLHKVASLPITEWQYKDESVTGANPGRHIGPMAQDFRAAFALGDDDKHIAIVDEGGVALAAIKGLNQKLEEKNAEIEALRQSVAELSKIVKALSEKK